MEATAIPQPDFTRVSGLVRELAGELDLVPNLPALRGGQQMTEVMNLVLEQVRLLNEKFDRLSGTVNVFNRNISARMANGIVVSREMPLTAMYHYETGESLPCPGTLAELEGLSSQEAAHLLRSLNEEVPRGYEDRKRRLKIAFGVRTQTI